MDRNRVTAFRTLLEVEENNAYSHLALKAEIAAQEPDSPAFVRELVYGVLENRTLLDYVLDRYLKQPASKLKARDRVMLRMGLYQIDKMDSVPDYAAVSETVNMAKKFCRGREGFINGVLRSYLRSGKEQYLPDPHTERIQFLSIRYSYEPWIVTMWEKEYGTGELEALLASGNRSPEFTVRANRLKVSREELKKRLEIRGFDVDVREDVPEGLVVRGGGVLDEDLYEQGLFSVQDAASMQAVLALDPRPGEFVMDVCAAPGGKTLYMAERMENRGRILAGDVYPAKLELIRAQAKRCGAEIIETRAADASKTDPQLKEKADRVLADVPCSGLGVLRRKPEIKYKKYDNEMKELPQKQVAILRASAEYVKPGGILVYSTCTIREAENQQVTGQFLQEDGRFQMELEKQYLPHKDGTDGFYICRMRKIGGTAKEIS